MTTRDVMAKAMSEDDLLTCCIDLARLLGWRVHHCRPAMSRSGKWATHIQGDPGFPDLVLAKEGRVLFVELKSQRGKTTDDQESWLFDLDEQAGVWRPSDWLDGTIDDILRSRA